MIVIRKRKLIATIIMFLAAAATYYATTEYWFEDADIIIKNQRDRFRSPEISQDVVIVGVDDKSFIEHPHYPWPRSDIGQIVNNLNAAGVDRIFFNIAFVKLSNEKEDLAFENALNRSSAKIFMPVAVDNMVKGGLIRNSSNKRFLKNATEIGMNGFYTNARRLSAIPLRSERMPDLTSLAVEVAQYEGTQPKEIPVDYAFEWKDLPVLSAIDVLKDKKNSRGLEGKTVIVGYYSNFFGNAFIAADGESIPGLAAQAIAANVLMHGNPYLVPKYVPIILAVLFITILVWYVRPYRAELLCWSAIPVFFVISILMESQLIYPENASAFILLVVGALYQRTAAHMDKLDEAAALDQEKSRFLARASHDLRQPIHAIGMFAARLGHTDLSTAQAEFVSKIERSVESASRLFQSLLDLSILESGGLKPDYQPTSLAELFNDLEKQNGIAAESAGIRLRFVPSQRAIMTDRVLLTTMIQNVISNAIKYAPGEEILLGCRRNNGSVSIWVCDRGIGMEQKELNKITEEFYRTSDSLDFGVQGSGLGLSIVKRLAAAMSLDVQIRSEVGRGTSFIISDFPVTQEAPVMYSDIETAQPQQLSGMRVMLIEDDHDSLKATESILQQWGCEVFAHEQIPPNPDECDVILSDFDFGSGKTLADHRAWIHEMERQDVVTIVISGHQHKRVHDAMQKRDMMILSKPVRPAELRSLLMACKMQTLTT